MSKRPPEPVHEEKRITAVQFLKSLESKDSKALKYVDPDKYIQHNLHTEDGLPVVRKPMLCPSRMNGSSGFSSLAIRLNRVMSSTSRSNPPSPKSPNCAAEGAVRPCPR